MGDWLKIYRSLLDWEWYSDANTMRVFIHLLLNANWKSNRWKGLEIPKGALIISLDKLSSELLLSKMQIRNTLTKLKSTREITCQSTRYGLIITLCKWGAYQDEAIDEQHAKQHAKQHGDNTQTNTEVTRRQHGGNTTIRREEGKKVRIEEELPPTSSGAKKDLRPTASELIDSIPDDLDPGTRAAAERFAKARQSYIPASKRFGTTGAFVQQCNRMRLYPVNVVIEAVDAAIAGEWKAWEQESIKSKQIGKAYVDNAFSEGRF